MDRVRWSFRPELRQPVLVAAFEGWNDAGDAASGALRWFADRWDATPFADIDPEEFYDFTASRPHVRLEGSRRVVDWPAVTLAAGTVPGTDVDVILLRGIEPGLRWRTFSETLVEVARSLEVRLVVMLGALLADVAHSRPVEVVGAADEDDAANSGLGLRPSRYEGPTGIVGVLHTAFRDADIPAASLWAAVPSYVPGAPSPKATLALVERTATLLGCGVVTTDLEIASAAYERQITELVDDDEETQEYVEALEHRFDEAGGFDSPDRFVEEVERFLREHGE